MRGRCGGISGRCGLACYSQNYSLPLVHDLGALCFRSIANAIWTNKPPTTTLWAPGALGNPHLRPSLGWPPTAQFRARAVLLLPRHIRQTLTRPHTPSPASADTTTHTQRLLPILAKGRTHSHIKPLFPTIPSHTLPESPPEVSQGCSPTIMHIPRGHLVYPLDTTLTQLQL